MALHLNKFLIIKVEKEVNDNLKKKLTVSDVKEIEKILELQKANCDETAKAEIDELIKKLNEMKVKF